jgi:tetratricopeptide (TPR) repeat protein
MHVIWDISALPGGSKRVFRKPLPGHNKKYSNMSSNWQIGDKIENRWEIHKILKGGMGIVYVVYDHEWHEAFAAKTFQDEIFAEDPAAADRFRHEALAWVGLDVHQNVTRAHLVRNFADRPFLFLEYVSGGDLSSWIGAPRLTSDLPQVLRFAIQFCDGMIHVLSKGIKAHRDIKPTNCLITQDNILKITDFGLAKVFDAIELKPSVQSSLQSGDINVLVSLTGSAAGTPPYMAPEQFDDVKHVDVRADIYSFGVMLFQMAEGRLPFVARSPLDFKRLHRSEPPPPLTIKNSRLDSLIQRCLAKDPAKRFADFTVMRGQLAEIYETLTGQSPSKPATGEQLDAGELINKGVSLKILGRPEEAIACFDRAIALRADIAPAYCNKGTSLEALGRPEEAIACFDHAIALEPDSAETHYNKGATLGSLERDEEAIACFDRAIALKPDYAKAHSLKGLSLDSLGRPEEAIACFDWAIKLEPDDAKTHFVKGVALEFSSRLEEAVIAYQKAHELGIADAVARIEECRQKLEIIEKILEPTASEPDEAEAQYNKGVSLFALGRYEEAIACHDRAIELQPDYANAHYYKGASLSATGRFEAALGCFERARDLGHPLSPKAVEVTRRYLAEEKARSGISRNGPGISKLEAAEHYDKGISLAELGRYDEAIACFDRAIALRPDFALGHYKKGILLENQKRLKEALHSYEQATGFPDADRRIVGCRVVIRREEEIVSYDRAIALNPDDVKAYVHKGDALTALGRCEEAVACYDRALLLRLDYTDAHASKGDALTALGRYEEAIACYDQALTLEPDNIYSLHHKGDALELLGHFAEAVTAYRRADDLGDEDAAAKIEACLQKLPPGGK